MKCQCGGELTQYYFNKMTCKVCGRNYYAPDYINIPAKDAKEPGSIGLDLAKNEAIYPNDDTNIFQKSEGKK